MSTETDLSLEIDLLLDFDFDLDTDLVRDLETLELAFGVDQNNQNNADVFHMQRKGPCVVLWDLQHEGCFRAHLWKMCNPEQHSLYQRRNQALEMPRSNLLDTVDATLLTASTLRDDPNVNRDNFIIYNRVIPK